MLHAQHPTIPPAKRERMSEPLPLDDPEALAQEVAYRAELVKQAGVMAGGNLRIAQHRDTLRYTQVCSGKHVPRLRRYNVGDFVLVRHNTAHSPEMPAAISFYVCLKRARMGRCCCRASAAASSPTT
jgi:hypothetical protein